MLQAVTSKAKACSPLKASDGFPSVRTEYSLSLLCVLFDHMETSGHVWPLASTEHGASLQVLYKLPHGINAASSVLHFLCGESHPLPAPPQPVKL